MGTHDGELQGSVPRGADASSRSIDIERIRRFLSWLIPIIFAFSIAQMAAALVLSDPRGLLVGLCIGFYGACLVWSRWALQRDRLELAVAIACVGLFPPDLLILTLEPALVATLALVPMLSVALALPFVPRKFLSRLFVGVWCWTVLIGLLVEVLPTRSDPAPWFAGVYRTAAVGAAAGMILLLLAQYRDRLTSAADAERAAGGCVSSRR
jgi:hypothetical protein